MSDLFLYDDARARQFEPFALTRPAGELRAGAMLLRARWEHALQRPCAGSLGAPHLADFEEQGAPRVVRDTVPAGAIVANARCAVAIANAPDADVWRCDGRVAAVRVPYPVAREELEEGARSLDTLVAPDARQASVNGRWIEEVWHLIRDLPTQLAEDVLALGAAAAPLPQSRDVGRAGGHPVFAEADVTVEPMVFIDSTAGPVLFRRGATVLAFTRIVGPCVVGEASTVGGDRIAASSIGDTCKVRGELSTSIILGHSNKGHDGFVGHSYLGRWVNLGAGTITSNLKNTYGSIALWTPSGLRDTGLQFLGAFLGDHAKTGIGTRLTTGCVVGAGANVFGSAMPPKVVAPFAWGDAPPYQTYELSRFLQGAERMMQRRGVVLGERARAQLGAAHAGRWTAA